jgi:hypothetical protein
MVANHRALKSTIVCSRLVEYPYCRPTVLLRVPLLSRTKAGLLALKADIADCTAHVRF